MLVTVSTWTTPCPRLPGWHSWSGTWGGTCRPASAAASCTPPASPRAAPSPSTAGGGPWSAAAGQAACCPARLHTSTRAMVTVGIHHHDLDTECRSSKMGTYIKTELLVKILTFNSVSVIICHFRFVRLAHVPASAAMLYTVHWTAVLLRCAHYMCTVLRSVSVYTVQSVHTSRAT